MILDEIIAHKRLEISEAKILKPLETLKESASQRHAGLFSQAIGAPDRLNLIAEVKKASPSRGVLCEDFDPTEIGRAYAESGAAAISVLTDLKYFHGKSEYLAEAKAASGLPALRKDFIIDEYQIWESVAIGADALLLIVAVLSQDQLRDYITLAGEVGLDALVEVHDKSQLEMALEAEAHIIGINNRDLRTFKTDLNTTVKLASDIPSGHIIVSESGIHTGEDARTVRQAGANAILVGEALVTSGDIFAKAQELIGGQG